MVKKEKIPPSSPPKETQLDLTVKTPTSRKTKLYDTWELENLGTYEALKKMISFS